MTNDSLDYYLKADSTQESAIYQFEVNEFSDLDVDAKLEQLTDCMAMNFINLTQIPSAPCDDPIYLAGACEFSADLSHENAFYLSSCSATQSNITPTIKTCFDDLCGNRFNIDGGDALILLSPLIVIFGGACLFATVFFGGRSIYKNYFSKDTNEHEPLVKNTSNSPSCFATLFSKAKACVGYTNNEYENMENVQNRI